MPSSQRNADSPSRLAPSRLGQALQAPLARISFEALERINAKQTTNSFLFRRKARFCFWGGRACPSVFLRGDEVPPFLGGGCFVPEGSLLCSVGCNLSWVCFPEKLKRKPKQFLGGCLENLLILSWE